MVHLRLKYVRSEAERTASPSGRRLLFAAGYFQYPDEEWRCGHHIPSALRRC